MAADSLSQFGQTFAPLLWQRELEMFGRTVGYRQRADLNTPLEIQGLWKEGAEGEPTSPGRYSILIVQNTSLNGGPQKGDQVWDGSVSFDVQRVEADAVGFSRLTLREQGNLVERTRRWAR
jgi:hypothetical protein